MKTKKRHANMSCYLTFLFIFAGVAVLHAQDRAQVWADEFNTGVIDLDNWAYDTGPSNDNVHYYTTRSENVQVGDGVLKIIALEESYNGFNYTSGLIKTKLSWRYGRVEARIKLPAGNGFVPAFWMLPADNIYGWWPNSGEIDIMEHPTNQVSTIYGTVHSETYNLFGGLTPPGDTVEVMDAESAFHLYAVEWTPDQIDFYVDDRLYFTFYNDAGGSATWPFDQPFYLILNLAVGGGWVGNPDQSTVFPAVMEVDYVRVYQYFEAISANGPDFIPYFSAATQYRLPGPAGATYSWEVPGNAQIVSGQNTDRVEVDWHYFGGDIKATVNAGDGSRVISYPVRVSANLLKNPGFEKGVKYWQASVGYPAEADLSLAADTVVNGQQSLSIDVQTLGANAWDIQCRQTQIQFESGQPYRLRFWAKTDDAPAEINLAFVKPDPFFLYYGEKIQLTGEWAPYEINYTATESESVNLNIDFGFQTGRIYLDDFLLTTAELLNSNQVVNGDFFMADANWDLVTHSGAQASGEVSDGAYRVSITNGGPNAWDIHLGQAGIKVENGLEYEVTFDAWAADARNITVLVGKNADPWDVYHAQQVFSLTTEKQTYTYTFVMGQPTDTGARFGFDIGASTTDVWFDNIRVSSGSTPTDISGNPAMPAAIRLWQNYPNPFNPGTMIHYELSELSTVVLTVYDLSGRKIKELVNQPQGPGLHSLYFDASGFASGVYIYTLQAGAFRQSRKMLLLK